MNYSEKQYVEALKKIKDNKKVSPLKVIRLKCLECTNFQEGEVRHCEIDDCILHAFRAGKNPVKQVISEERRKAMSERMKKIQARRQQR